MFRKVAMVLLAAAILYSFSGGKGKPAYVVFNKKGKASSYKSLVKQCAGADIVLFGELHNNPICHWLELEVTKDLYALKKQQLVLGAEMFEADNQLVLDSFLRGEIDDKGLKRGCRLWPNYATDYKPLVDFAAKNKLPFVAANIPRRYASKVFKGDFGALDTLSALEKSWIAPLPIWYDSTLPCYKNMLDMMEGHAKATFPKAQAIKDATMSYFILKNFKKGQLFLHYNGSYHSNNFESIYAYLKHQDPSLKIVTIASTEQDNVSKLEKENQKLADFILVIPESMTKTY